MFLQFQTCAKFNAKHSKLIFEGRSRVNFCQFLLCTKLDTRDFIMCTPNKKRSGSGKGKSTHENEELEKVVLKDLEGDPFTIRIFNTLTYQQTKLTITKKYTLKDVQDAYFVFESHPEYYLWQNMFGDTLDLDKTVVENKLVGEDEVVEFDGIGKEPVIMLFFKDGFEHEFPFTLNPLNNGNKEMGRCRNY